MASLFKKSNVVYGVSIILSGLITIFIVGSIVAASISTQRLLEYHQQESLSSSALPNDSGIKLENSIWARCPKWGMAVIAGVTGLVSFPAFATFFMVMFGRLFRPEK